MLDQLNTAIRFIRTSGITELRKKNISKHRQRRLMAEKNVTQTMLNHDWLTAFRHQHLNTDAFKAFIEFVGLVLADSETFPNISKKLIEAAVPLAKRYIKENSLVDQSEHAFYPTVVNFLIALAIPEPNDIQRLVPYSHQTRGLSRFLQRNQQRIQPALGPIITVPDIADGYEEDSGPQAIIEDNPVADLLHILSAAHGPDYDVADSSLERQSRFSKLYPHLPKVVGATHNVVQRNQYKLSDFRQQLLLVHEAVYVDYLIARAELAQSLSTRVPIDWPLHLIFPKQETDGRAAETFVCPKLLASLCENLEIISEDVDEHAATAMIIRPPSHHACSGETSGFCVANLTAMRAIQDLMNGKKVLWLDVDFHDGDGNRSILDKFLTENLKYKDNIYFINMYNSATFPGKLPNRRNEELSGVIRNIAYTTKDAGSYLTKYRKELNAISKLRFSPDRVLFSLGTDACKFDRFHGPLLPINYQNLIEIASEKFRDSKLLAVSEGGYNPDAVAACWKHTLQGLYQHALQHQLRAKALAEQSIPPAIALPPARRRLPPEQLAAVLGHSVPQQGSTHAKTRTNKRNRTPSRAAETLSQPQHRTEKAKPASRSKRRKKATPAVPSALQQLHLHNHRSRQILSPQAQQPQKQLGGLSPQERCTVS